MGVSAPLPAAPVPSPAAAPAGSGSGAERGVGRGAGGAGRRAALVAGALVLLLALAVTSLFVGSGSIPARTVVDALTGTGTGTAELLVRDYRLPRTLLALLVGLALGLAGVVMQALTRNPLADPGLLGVNAGAYAAVVAGTAFFGASATTGQLGWGIAGAAVAACVVYVVGTTGAGARTPAKLVLGGVAIGAVLSSAGRAVTLQQPEVFDRLRFWDAGSLQGRTASSVTAVVAPVLVAAAVVALLARSLNALSMGDDVARALGARVALVRLVGFVAVTVLCGAATAVAGPISFVGLVVPFVARFVVGVDHRWIVAFTAVAGPALVVAADVLGRVLVPSELPVGVVTAFVGAPVLVVLVRRTRLRSL